MASSRYRVLLTVAGAIGVALLGLALSARTTTPDQLQESLQPQTSDPVTVPVVSEVLTRVVVGRGSVEFLGESEVVLPAMPGLAGSLPIVTALPEISTRVGPGSVLLEIAYRPVLVLSGVRPLVRDLHRGDTGADVEELQMSLTNLGLLEAEAVDGTFGRLTELAVADLYSATGYSPPKQRGHPYVAMAEIYMAQELPVFVRQLSTSVGQLATAGSSLMTISSASTRLVTALPIFEVEFLRGGENVAVLDEATGRSAQGVIEEVGAVPDPELGGVPVFVSLSSELPDDRQYKVTIELATTDGPVTAVPETAVYLGSGDTTYVLKFENGATHRIDVVTGMAGTDGYVEVRPLQPGNSLAPGDLVAIGAPP